MKAIPACSECDTNGAELEWLEIDFTSSTVTLYLYCRFCRRHTHISLADIISQAKEAEDG